MAYKIFMKEKKILMWETKNEADGTGNLASTWSIFKLQIIK